MDHFIDKNTILFDKSWRAEGDKFLIEHGVISGKIFFTKVSGHIDHDSIALAGESLLKLFGTGRLDKSRYIRILDYSDLKSQTITARRKHLALMSYLNMCHNCSSEKIIICGASSEIKSLCFLFSIYQGTDFFFTESTDEAFAFINRTSKHKSFSSPLSTKEILKQNKNIKSLLNYAAKLLFSDDSTALPSLQNGCHLELTNALKLLHHDCRTLKQDFKAIEKQNETIKQDYHNFFLNALSGIAVHKMVFDESGKPQDYIFLEANAAFEKLTGLKAHNIIGKKVSEVIPGIQETRFIKIYGEVVLTGKAVRFDEYADPLKKHYTINAFKTGPDKFATIFEDITDLKLAEKRLNHELRDQKSHIRAAAKVQELLNDFKIPLFNGFNINACSIASECLNGDYLKITKTHRNDMIVILGDSTGHGIEASIQQTVLKLICDKHYEILNTSDNIVLFLEQINKEIQNYTFEGKFPTLFVAKIDTEKRILHYGAANGEIPLIKEGSHIFEPSRVKGFHLGYSNETVFEQKSLRLKNCSEILIFSDGLIELNQSEWNRHNRSALLNFIKSHEISYEGDFNELIRHVLNLSTKSQLKDDLSLAVIKFQKPFFKSFKINHTTFSSKKTPLNTKQIFQNFEWNLFIEKLSSFGFNNQTIKKMTATAEIIRKEATTLKIKSKLSYYVSFKKIKVTLFSKNRMISKVKQCPVLINICGENEVPGKKHFIKKTEQFHKEFDLNVKTVHNTKKHTLCIIFMKSAESVKR